MIMPQKNDKSQTLIHRDFYAVPIYLNYKKYILICNDSKRFVVLVST